MLESIKLEILAIMDDFEKEMKGTTKVSQKRARVLSSKLTKALKEFRKFSLQEEKQKWKNQF